GDGRPRPLARGSINLALSAVIFFHRDAGFPFDRKHRVIARTWAGISKNKAKTEIVRKAKPLLATDLRDIVESCSSKRTSKRKGKPLKTNKEAIDARDAALLTLCWSGAMRRSELVGLDWQKRGDGTGYVSITERGIEITLMTSKASQDAAESIAIP